MNNQITLNQTMTSTPPSQEVIQAWQNRIKTIQLERVTPEVIQRIQEHSSRATKAKHSLRQASRIERVNYLQSVSNQQTLQYYSEISAPSRNLHSRPVEEAREMAEASDTYQRRSRSLMGILHSAKSAPSPVRQLATVARRISSQGQEPVNDDMNDADSNVVNAVSAVNESEEDDEEESELMTLEQELGVPNLAQVALEGNSAMGIDLTTAQQSVATGVDELLNQLKKEPTGETELNAKFQLFETFLETVISIRNTTIEFWTENCDQFEGSSRQAQQKMIDGIDASDKLGIPDDPSKWFVYHMTRQANQNSKAISNVLSLMKGKLNILSQDLGECPFCLDQLTPQTSVTLSCCHRSCKSCWENWTAIKGSRAFCPLCNHNEFIGELVSA